MSRKTWDNLFGNVSYNWAKCLLLFVAAQAEAGSVEELTEAELEDQQVLRIVHQIQKDEL